MEFAPKLRTAATLGLLTILLLLGLVWGWTQLTQPLPGLAGPSSAPADPCTVRTLTKGTRLTPEQVTVSVFNAGETDGLATRTIDQLAVRGFAPGATGNAPGTAAVDTVQIWSNEPRNPAVRLVASNLGGSVEVVPPTGAPLGVGVVVVVGDDFRRVVRGDDSTRVRSDASVCVPNQSPN